MGGRIERGREREGQEREEGGREERGRKGGAIPTLRSRWTMFKVCRCLTPSRIWYTTSLAFSSGRGSIAITRNSSPPVALEKEEARERE